MADEKTENVEEPEVAAAPEAPAADATAAAPKKPRAKAKKATVKAPLTPAERHDARLVVRGKKATARRTERAQAREKAKGRAHQASVTPPREHVEGTQKTRQGIVVSDKATKTITVRIDVARRHRRYSKIVRTSQTFHAHDEQSDAHIGDTVVIRECRPMSRLKRWRLVEVLERAK
jgi:small subunit ribosomal protein S17